MESTTSLCLFLAGVSFFFLRLLFHYRGRSRRLPPGPRPLPLIGNLLDMGGQHPHRALARLSRAHGPLMTIRLGTVTTVVASSTDTAREILQKHDAVFADRDMPDVALARAHGSRSLLWLPPGSQWRGLRWALTTKLFSPQQLDAFKSLRREKLRVMLDYVRKLADAGEPVDVGRLISSTILNLLSNTLLSVDIAEMSRIASSGDFQHDVEAFVGLDFTRNISDVFPILAPADLQGMRRTSVKLVDKLYAVFDELIDRRQRERDAGEPSKNDSLDLLLDLSALSDKEGFRLDRATLRVLLTDLFAAGSDASSDTVEWAMTELLQNPEAMAKVQEELKNNVGSGAIEESDITSLPYLQAVVKETMRMHPSVPILLPRRPSVDMDIAGYTVPEGARVLVNVWAIGRDPSVWPEPEKFSPERFLGDKGCSVVEFTGRDFQLLPFGSGRRICAGLPLANRMVHVILGSLLKNFQWRVDGELAAAAADMTEKFGVTLAKAVRLRAYAAAI